jgi:hypothetical protein
LSEVLHHRVCSVAQQRDPAVDPALDRITVAQDPELPILAVTDDVLRARVDVPESAAHLLLADGLAGYRLGRVVVVGHDQVEHLAEAAPGRQPDAE